MNIDFSCKYYFGSIPFARLPLFPLVSFSWLEFFVCAVQKEMDVYPSNTSVQDALDLFYQLYSLLFTTRSLSVLAATFANGGVCPLTGKACVNERSVKDLLVVRTDFF